MNRYDFEMSSKVIRHSTPVVLLSVLLLLSVGSLNGADVKSTLLEHGVEEIVFSERGPGMDYGPNGPTPSHYYANFGYACIDSNFWMHAEDGSRLCKLNIKSGELVVILDEPKGSIRDPQVHYDAEKILFSYRKAETHYYNLYEIGIDGNNLKQLTFGDWDDIEPTYLPDGGIIFCSSRCKRYIGCWVAPSAILHRCDADGSNIRMLSSSPESENTPAVLPDGRILFTRWEYVNRDPVVFHHLWSMNPDGTGQKIYYGNMHPGGVFIDARPIPGSDRVVFINSPGHGQAEHGGILSTVSDKQGPDDRSAVTALVASSVGKKRHRRAPSYRDPWAVASDTFLAALNNSIVVVKDDRTEYTLHTSKMMVHEPRPIIQRERERIIPRQCDLSKDYATLILNNVYEGRNMAGIKPGSIKKLLVIEDLPKPANYHGGGSQPIGHGVTSTLKRLLGWVPVEEDGSASFRVPPMRSIYLAALDENDLSVKQMRSFMTLQPGETQNCIGCHEHRTQSPTANVSRPPMALKRSPSEITPYKDIPAIPDFPRDIQPILDKHCIKCHSHSKRSGGVTLAGDRGPVFSHSYYSLILHWQIKDTAGQPGHNSGRQHGNDKPYACYSYASPLMKKIDGSHHDVVLSEKEMRAIRLWLDVNSQYAGTYAAFGTGQVGGCWGWNKPIRAMADKWPSTAPAVEAVSRRCLSCHGKMFPKHVTDAKMPLDHGDMLSWTRPMSRFSRHNIYNLSNPDKSLILLTPLSKKAGGYAEGKPETKPVHENRRESPKPIVHPVIFENRDDPDYKLILAHVTAAKAKLDEIKRFDMPGFRPHDAYVREMKRFGILPANFDNSKDPIDVYKTDEKYWQSLWHKTESSK